MQLEILFQLDPESLKFLDSLNIDEQTLLATGEKVYEYLRDLMTERFRSGSGPEGPWAVLTRKTQKQRVRMGYSPNNILIRTGSLRASFIDPNDPHHIHRVFAIADGVVNVVYGSSNILAEYAETGNPQRLLVGLNDDQERDIADRIDDILRPVFG